MILLVQSQDHREYLWKSWLRYFKKSGWDVDPMIITEDKKPDFIKSVQTGSQSENSFGSCLLRALDYFKDEYVWYTLDDYFIVKKIAWDVYEEIALNKKVDAFRLQPNVQIDSLPYKFIREDGLLRQTNNSKYQISFQTSIWRKDFLAGCMDDRMNPWELENSTKIDKWKHKIYFAEKLPWWYYDIVRRGKLSDIGKLMIK